MSEFIESITPPPDENRNSPNAFSNDDVITRTAKSFTVGDVFSPIVPTAIKRFYNANQEIKEQERSRSEVSSLASATGFEVFPSTYKQTKVGSDNMSTNYLDTISNFFGSTVGNIASGLENIAGPVNRIGRFGS